MTEPARVYVLDDEPAIVESLQEVLSEAGYHVKGATDPRFALNEIEEFLPATVLLDLRLPHLDGSEVFARLRRRDPDLPVVIITAHGDVETAVHFVRQGAFDFIEKPLNRERILLAVRNAVHQYRLARSEREWAHWGAPPRLLGNSKAMQELRSAIERAARTDATVLVVGESGSGKELVAWEVHRRSSRARGPFVRVNCAAIPRELIESELFGHRKGSFTGAVRDQVGKFEQAHGGTLFLDEIGDMSLEAQAKILRVLESGEIEPIGAAQPRQVDVRVVAATNQDLRRLMREGRFREDLYYRLHVVVIRVPPLREHAEDIPMLVEWFGERFVQRNGLPQRNWSAEALEWMMALSWPGNVRQLRHFVEYCLTMHGDRVLRLKDVQRYWQEQTPGHEVELPGAEPTTAGTWQPLRRFLEEREKAYIEAALRAAGGNVAQAARMLKIPRSNLYKKMEKYDIKIRKDVE